MTEKNFEEKLNFRFRNTKQHYCFNCGTPWPSHMAQCEACGGTDRSIGSARPRTLTKNTSIAYDGPWKMINWPSQGSVCLYGGPGSGKSSMAALIRPTLWITKEQEPQPAGLMFNRVTPGFMPRIVAADTLRDVADELYLLEKGPVVIDSLTSFGMKEGLMAAHLLVNWCRDRNDRGLAIVQVNSRGGTAGLMEIPHLFDSVVNLTPDPWGVRAFRIEKSRWSSLEAQYWLFNHTGQIDTPDFPAAYSVEGTPGSYWLQPYPLKGAKWSGLLSALDTHGLLRPRTACAAAEANYMDHGFMEPMDVQERQRFAERNGLTWMRPEDYDLTTEED